MKLSLFFTLVMLSLCSCAKDKKVVRKAKALAWIKTDFNWSQPQFAYIKAYFYHTYQSKITGELVEKRYPEVIVQGVKNRAIWNNDGALLNTEQEQILLDFVQGKLETPEDYARYGIFEELELTCDIDPHHGFVFYNQKDQPIASISVCYLCQGVLVHPKGSLGQNLLALQPILQELGIAIPKNTHEFLRYSKEYKSSTASSEKIYAEQEVNTIPQFATDGFTSMQKYVDQFQRKYPTILLDGFYVHLVIEADGEVSQLEIPKHKESDFPILYLWNTQWQPGLRNGIAVRTQLKRWISTPL